MAFRRKRYLPLIAIFTFAVFYFIGIIALRNVERNNNHVYYGIDKDNIINRSGKQLPVLVSPVYSVHEMPPIPNTDTTGQEIPRILHRMWKTWKVPAHLMGNITSWSQKSTPGFWTHVFWTDDLIDRFVQRTYPQLHPWFKALPTQIFRSDVARYLILHTYGGVYADLDVELMRSVEPLLNRHTAIVCREPELFALGLALPSLILACNAVLMSVPGHPFWAHMIHEMIATKGAGHPVLDTGPVKLTVTLNSYSKIMPSYVDVQKAVFLTPPSYFYPSFKELYTSDRVTAIFDVCSRFLDQWKSSDYPSIPLCQKMFETKTVNWELAKSHIPWDLDVTYTRHYAVSTWTTTGHLDDDIPYQDIRLMVKNVKTYIDLDETLT